MAYRKPHITYVADYGTTAAAINAAIAASPVGGIVQLDPITYNLGGSTINITDSVTLQGSGQRLDLWGASFAAPSGTLLVQTGAVDAIRVNYVSLQGGVFRTTVIRDLVISLGTNGVGVHVEPPVVYAAHTANALNNPCDNVHVENVGVLNGSIAVKAIQSDGIRLRHCWFRSQTSYGVYLNRGWRDAGGLTLDDVQCVAGSAGYEGIRQIDAGPIFMRGCGQDQGAYGLHVSQTAGGTEPGASQFTITGNEWTIGTGAATGTSGSVIFFDGVYGGGNIQITGNLMNSSSLSAGPAIRVDGTSTGYWFGLVITGNYISVDGRSNLGTSITNAGCLSLNRAMGVTFVGNHLNVYDGGYATNNADPAGGSVRIGPNNLFEVNSLNPFLGSGFTLDHVTLDGNSVAGAFNTTKNAATSAFTLVNLPTVNIGSMVYCTDCVPGANPCTAATTPWATFGTLAVRSEQQGPTWRCL